MISLNTVFKVLGFCYLIGVKIIFICDIFDCVEMLKNGQDLYWPSENINNPWMSGIESVEDYVKNQHHNWKLENSTDQFSKVSDPVLVWWNPIIGTPPNRTVQCGKLSCYVTIYREFLRHPLFKGFIFYGTFVDDLTDLPLPRNGSSVFWALFHDDISRLNMVFSHEEFLSLFNYTATFSRHSNFPLTTRYLYNLDALTDLEYLVTTEKKTLYQKDEKWSLAPVLYIQSNCDTSNDRDVYVAELSKYIRVDSYGVCLHNRNLPPQLQYPHFARTIMSDENMQLLGKYKFTLSIENRICEDYISEKLWRPFISGSVPIYIGSPSVVDWLPNNHSAILGLNFKSPKELAEYLIYLNTHDVEYNKYLLHKHDCLVTNRNLIQVVSKERWEPNSEYNTYVSGFECFLCHKAHNPDRVSIATLDHYDCPMPVSILSRKPNKTNHWLDSWFQGLCKAEVFRSYVDSGVSNISAEEFKYALELIKTKYNFSF